MGDVKNAINTLKTKDAIYKIYLKIKRNTVS